MVSNLTQTTFGNGTREVRQYDNLNRLEQLENWQGTVKLASYDYALDKVGNRVQIDEFQNGEARTLTYVYDDLYRLTKEVIDAAGTQNDLTQEYGYDNVGNRQWKKVMANGSTTQTDYTYDDNDRLLNGMVSGVETVGYTYDNNGSTLTKTEAAGTTTYTWDDEKRLIAATVNGQQIEYRYNDQGIRVSSKQNGVETRYLLDEGIVANVWEEYSPSGTVQTAYIYGNDLISQTQAGQTTFYLVDGLGSTRLLTNDQGTIVNDYHYDAYGKTIGGTSTTENKYRFAGEQFDENLGDYYLRQRFYDTDTGRFGRRDVYEGRLREPLSLHKYIYTHNNPTNLIDPSGFSTFLTLPQLKEIGDEIHEKISENFVSQDSANRRADFRRKGEGLTVGRILKEADGLPNGHFPWNGRKPDLADYSVREVYEIKSKSRYAEGVVQLLINLAALNLAPGQTHEWDEGKAYTYSGGYIALPYGKVATVNPPSNGVITYNLLDLNPRSQISTSTSIVQASFAILTALILAASARRAFA